MEAQLTRTSGLSLRRLRLVNFVRDQFLAGAGFAENQNRSVGGRDEINLAGDLPQRRALADQIAERFGFNDFFLEIGILLLQFRLEFLNFLEGPRVRDGSAEVIGENLLPGMPVFRER